MADFVPLENPSSWRKMAAGVWSRPDDPTIYGSMDVEATELLAFLPRYREREGVKITITHLVASALARAIARRPEVNCKVRFWGKLEQRTSVDVFLQVAAEGGRDLSGARIERADEMTLGELARDVAEKANVIRTGSDPTYKKSRGMFKTMPWWATRPLLKLSDLLVNELNFDLSGQGMPRDPFGSAMVTSVGMFGIDTAFAPLVPIARCPILVLVPEVRVRPWVVGDQVLPRPVLRLCATFDHRVLDGAQAGRLAAELIKILAEPEALTSLPA
jgi:pyruvate/2-oxoglutarate dehydrogenase complex dihydrolipoamide acyltransferase (E2) component